MSGATGGRADKLGNRYEGLWVANQLLHLLAERITAVQVEAIGEDERGVDVWVTKSDGIREAQQCKRKNRTTGKWGISELSRQGVLGYLSSQLLRDVTIRYTFVSAHPAPELRELCDMARRAGGKADVYFLDTMAVAAHADHLRRFCREVGADPANPSGRQLAFGLLQRTFTHLFEDSPEGQATVEVLARCLIDGEPKTSIEVLANYAEDQLGEILTVEQVRQHLRERGLPPISLLGHPQAVVQVEHLRDEFRESLRPSLIQSTLVPRPEATTVFDLLTGQNDRRLVVLHGRSGAGKSCVLLQLVELLEQAGISHLPLRLDRRHPRTSSRRYGIDGCDLPESPAVVLHLLNPGRRVVLIVDQLDAVRWTAAHASAPWEACREVIDDALALPDVAVVVACRTFDLRDDQQIRAWHTARRGHEVAVGDLSDVAVAEVVASAGGNHAEFTPRQKELLRSPLHLALWVQATEDGRQVGIWATQADLLRAFWRSRFDMAERMGVSPAETRDAVSALVNEMDRRGRLTAPARTLETYPRAADVLRSLNVVVEAGGRLAFAHQSYFEYRLAARLLDETQGGGRSVMDWIRERDQSLLRRDQLRLVLTLLRDEDHGEYVRTLRDLILAPAGAVRFHLRQLTLRVLGEAPGPSPQEGELACELIGNREWRDHALDQVFSRQPAWFDAADTRGLVARWLGSAEEREIDLGLAVCRWWSGQRGDRVAELFDTYLCQPDPWPRRIAGAIPFKPTDETPALFQLRLALIRDGIVRHSFLMAKELSERFPERLIDLLDAHLNRREANPQEPSETPAHDRGFPYFLPFHEVDHLERVANDFPDAVWHRLMPHIVRMCERTRRVEDERRTTPFFQDDTWPPDRLYMYEPNIELLQLVAGAGAKVVSNDPAGFAIRHAEWLNHPGLSVQRIVGLALASADAAASDLAIGWLCDNPNRLSLVDKQGRNWGIAQQIIRRHATTCSSAVYARLEQTLLRYYEPQERRSMEWQLHSVRSGWLRANDYGLSQHALLPCLPDSHISNTVRSEIGVLERKFGRPAAECDRDRLGRSRTIVGPLRHDRTARITDRGWLQIIKGVNRVRGFHHREVDEDTVADTSSEGFAASLGERAKWEPGRFARLALLLPASADTAYLVDILYAVAAASPPTTDCHDWKPATDDEVRAVVEHVGYSENERIAHGLVWLMRQRHRSLSSPNCHALIRRYATEHLHPTARWTVSSNREPDLDAESLNCTRGIAVGIITQLLFDEPCFGSVFESTLRKAAEDIHSAVRVAVIGACLPILNGDRNLAVNLFLATCNGPDDILASRWVSEFIRYTLWSHQKELTPLLRRMAESSTPAVATKGAVWLTAGSLDDRFPHQDVDRLACGTPAQRRGVARAAAHNCGNPKRLVRCVELLGQLIDDSDEGVRKEAGEFVRQDGLLRSAEGRQLASAFVAGREFGREPMGMVEALRRHTDSLIPLAPVMKAVCLRVAGDLSDLTKRAELQGGYALDRFVPLILRLYEQAEQVSDGILRSDCLDCWDQLLEARMGGTAQILGELDAADTLLM
jgi:hypothetical protein